MDLHSTIQSLMVEIPAGKVKLRDDRLKREWTVDLASFFMSKYAVSQELYRRVTNENPSVFKGNNRPVESINWLEAALFCNSLSAQMGFQKCYRLNKTDEILFEPRANGYRLPWEAEWQYACLAKTKGVRYGDLELIAWYKNNSQNQTHEVGIKKPNAWGLYDMLGNVWEWCNDLYDTEVYGTYRVFRGGGWNDTERSLMATVRRRSHPTKFKIDDLGFRIVRNNNFNSQVS